MHFCLRQKKNESTILLGWPEKNLSHVLCFTASLHYTVWSEVFLYKVAPPELKISPIMYFVIHNSVVLSKILKIIVPLKHNFKKNQFFQKIFSNRIMLFNILDNTTELWVTKFIIDEFFSSGRATLYKNTSDQTV